MIPEYTALKIPWLDAGSMMPAASPQSNRPLFTSGLNARHLTFQTFGGASRGKLLNCSGGRNLSSRSWPDGSSYSARLFPGIASSSDLLRLKKRSLDRYPCRYRRRTRRPGVGYNIFSLVSVSAGYLAPAAAVDDISGLEFFPCIANQPVTRSFSTNKVVTVPFSIWVPCSRAACRKSRQKACLSICEPSILRPVGC